MTNDLSLFYAQKYALDVKQGKYPFKLCRIADSGGDISKIWYVEYWVWNDKTKKLQRRRTRLSQATKKERYAAGKEFSSEIDVLLKAGAVMEDQEKKTVDIVTAATNILDAIDYYNSIVQSYLEKKTYDTYQSDFRRFKKFLKRNDYEKLSVNDVSTQIAYQFLDEILIIDKLSNRTRNNNKGTMASFFNFFRKRKMFEHNPFDDISKLSAPQTKHVTFSNAHLQEFRKLVEYHDEERMWLFLNFMYYCALRPRKELRLLKIGNIMRETIRVGAAESKEDISEHVQIPPPLAALIEKYKLRDYPENYYIFSGRDGSPGPEPQGRDWMYNRHRNILRLCKIKRTGVDMYSWKHTGMATLYQATQSVQLVRQQCRHKNISTTEIYLRDLGEFVDNTQINKFPAI
jgi:integrase